MDRYWVGGTASWDGTAGTKWALTSGGTGGEAVPTTADDVFFSVLSTGTCTISTGNTGAKSIDCTGFTGTLTGSAAITVSGSVTLNAVMTYDFNTTITINGTGTIITAGKSLGFLDINGTGITVTLGDAYTAVGRTIAFTRGTFDTAGYSVTVTTLNSSNSNVRAINLNASTITLSSNLVFGTTTNLTLNAGTSQINFSAAAAVFQGGSKTFYNVSFTNVNIGTRTLTGANTFNNLTLNASANNGLSQLSIDSNQTVNGTLTCAGSSIIARAFVRSDTLGTTRTITAAAVSANNCDFRDITIAGAAAPISPLRAGDCGGNSGITFPAAKNSYRVGTDSTWSGTSSWSLTSGGPSGFDNFPLAQDTAIINNDTTLTGTLSLSLVYNIGSFDCSARTNAGPNIAHSGLNIYYGSYILGSGVTISGTTTQTFSGRGTQTFTSAGKTITFQITVDKPAGAFELGDAFSSNTTLTSITHNRGTFDAKTYNLTCTAFDSSNATVRTINMGSGLWSITGTGTVWGISTTTLTLNKNTANILLSNPSTTARTFSAGAGISYNTLTIGGTTSTSTTVIANGIFTELASTKTVAHTILVTSSPTFTTFSVTGTAGNVCTFASSSVGVRRTVTVTNSTAGLLNYMSVKDIGIVASNVFYVGNNSIDGGNNLNVYFTSGTVATGSMFFMFN